MANNGILEVGKGTGQRDQGISAQAFLASLVTAIAVFSVETALFLLLKGKLTRIYQPRTYLVPDRERTKPSPPGLFRWIVEVFRTSNSEFIRKCGLDAYFFLRYLRMLLKIFVPLGLLILPILLPLNKVNGKDQSTEGRLNNTRWNVTGLDQLAWGNVAPNHTDRYWAHLILAVISICYVCAVFFDELRGYIRLRQAYLTSPQHRLRASATTVLITAIPEKWLSVEALEQLYDVFPGGIRNIWINRNFDELNEKIKLRNDLAQRLEAAETELIRKCKKAHLKKLKAKRKRGGDDALEKDEEDVRRRAAQIANEPGISSGNPHQVVHTIEEALKRSSRMGHTQGQQRKPLMPLVGNGLNAVSNGATALGKTVLNGFKRTGDEADGQGDPEVLDSSQRISQASQESEPGPSISVSDYSESSPSESTPDKPASSRPNSSRLFRKHTTFAGSSQRFALHRDPQADEIPLTKPSMDSPRENDSNETSKTRENQRKQDQATKNDEYPKAYNENADEGFGEPLWKKYIRPQDRETMRLPIFGWTWMPSLPLIGKKVDTIDYCRKEVARLNVEIEHDQQHPEKFPLMNSAFVQFNHQVAAHMACQTVNHHIPKQMAPRIVEISPDDVIWDNMSIRWWERYLRTSGVVILVCGMVIGWAFPVAFTGVLSQLSYLEDNFSWLAWLALLPDWLLSAIQGILPPLFLAILMAILPLILRFLSKVQGLQTGMAIELAVSNYYFAFLFVQIFLVVAIASSLSTIFDSVTDITSWPQILATNIPKSSNYFFSYMILQAMSVSAGALVQLFGLINWFILAPIFDDTARKKFVRTTTLNQVRWGTFFPVYTTLGSIGLIYLVIAPLIAIFNVITFGLFWFVYRYNTLYVTQFRFDTGGLLFPKAINQLFTGLYVMELSLIGMFFLVRDQDESVACQGQAIVMIVVLILTVLYQIFLNEAFSPLIRYLPITLEDDAARRDEEFARAQQARFGRRGKLEEDGNKSQRTEDIELKSIEAGESDGKHLAPTRSNEHKSKRSTIFQIQNKILDEEAQDPTGSSRGIGRSLFAGIHDELEDLTPEERDQLVQRAFLHEALRARRPVIWIPRDDIGVSDDEIYRTQRFSEHIWISNEYQTLDENCRPVFTRSPPDFSEVDLIQL